MKVETIFEQPILISTFQTEVQEKNFFFKWVSTFLEKTFSTLNNKKIFSNFLGFKIREKSRLV